MSGSPVYGFAYGGIIYPCNHAWDTHNTEAIGNKLSKLNVQDIIFDPNKSNEVASLRPANMELTLIGDLVIFWKIIFSKIEGNSVDYFQKLSRMGVSSEFGL